MLTRVEPAERDDGDVAQDVWGLEGSGSIGKRTETLIDDAAEEIVFVVGEETVPTQEFLDQLDDASNRVDVVVGTRTAATQKRIRERIPNARVFVSGLEWLNNLDDNGETAVGRLLLVDKETILLSSNGHDGEAELGVYSHGFNNGLVAISRRLMATGLPADEDPGGP